jgi:carboxylesterase type B
MEEGAVANFPVSQMALYNGDNLYNGAPLFHSAIMDGGSIAPADPVDCLKGQVVYDTVVSKAGCSNYTDTLECLRRAPYETFLNASNSVPAIFGFNSVALSYLPRPDGTSLVSSPEVVLKAGNITQIPYIVGDQEDEGTLFSLLQTNISTTSDLENYLSTLYFNGASPQQISSLVASYPDDPTAGSPFRTGTQYNIYPQYKRLAALLGDITFTLTRRYFLTQTAINTPSIPIYSYLNSYGFGTPVLGTFHTSYVPQIFGGLQDAASSTIQAYYISFFNEMDPNGAVGEMTWPTWADGNILINFNKEGGSKLLADTFRNESYTILVENQASFHI